MIIHFSFVFSTLYYANEMREDLRFLVCVALFHTLSELCSIYGSYLEKTYLNQPKLVLTGLSAQSGWSVGFRGDWAAKPQLLRLFLFILTLNFYDLIT